MTAGTDRRLRPRGNRPHLIAYADRFGGSLAGLHDLLATRFSGIFAGVHVLPYYLPFDGADAGFDPIDHAAVDERLGTWDDLRSMAGHMAVVSDLIVNHISSRSAEFQDVVRHGGASPHAGMFLTMDSVFPAGAVEADLTRIYRPRPGLPFTAMRLGGRKRLVWTTFTPGQVDLDVRDEGTWAYLCRVVDRLTAAGVSVLRLDAIGYAGKVAGTDCFLTPGTLALIERLRGYVRSRGATTLLEVHGHHTQVAEVAATADLVYDFALPPLVLHAIFNADPGPLADWLAVRPANCVTVLDTHDGIGLMDAARNELRPDEPGLLDDAQVSALYRDVLANGGDSTRRSTGEAASNLDLYQVNCTFYDAVGRDDRRYLVARGLQLFLPGLPQVYYVGLLAGSNDVELFERTGTGRDVNRHHYTLAEVDDQLHRPVVRAQLELVRLRAQHPAFDGNFSFERSGSVLRLSWQAGAEEVCLEADLAGPTFRAQGRSGTTAWELDVDALLSGLVAPVGRGTLLP